MSITPPNAAYTVALGIQANAMKARSLYVYFFSNAAMKVPSHLAVTPIRIVPKLLPMMLGSIFSKRTAAPTVPNRKG